MANTRELIEKMIIDLRDQGNSEEQIVSILTDKAVALKKQGWKEALIASAITALLAVGGVFVVRRIIKKHNEKKAAQSADNQASAPEEKKTENPTTESEKK